MTVYGIDAAWSRPSIAFILSAGYSFVCRYLSYDTTGKNLSRLEADAYKAAGIAVVSNWEYATDAALGGYAQGVADAKAAVAQHNACGGPVSAPIYFSADWDVSDAQKPTVGQYYRGVASVIGLARTGAYGSYWLIKYLLDNRLIEWGWQTYAWSAGNWDSRAQLRQIQNAIKVGGADVDRNQAMTANYGQWNANDGGLSVADINSLTQQLTDLRSVVNKVANETDFALAADVKGIHADVKDVQSKVNALTSELDAVKAAQGTPTPVAVDYASVANQLVNTPAFYTQLAKAFVDEEARRLAA